MVQAGLLRHKLLIQESTSGSLKSADTGEFLPVWTDYATSVWCSVNPVSGAEIFREDQRYILNTLQFGIRYSSAKPVDQGMRIVYSGNNYNITEVINADFRNRLLMITGELVT